MYVLEWHQEMMPEEIRLLSFQHKQICRILRGDREGVWRREGPKSDSRDGADEGLKRAFLMS